MGLLIGVGQTRPQFAYDYYYGIEWDTSVSNPSCTRIGKAELHAELPLQKMMRRCLLADDGTVNHYLHPNDSTKLDTGAAADLTGASGQVMVELPDVYIRFEEEGTKRRCLMSPHALPGFKKWGKDYVSAYEATVQRSVGKLSSVDNHTADYRGCGNQAEWDGIVTSALGKPATNISAVDFRTYAHNRGDGWQCHTYRIHKKLFWLFAVEYATLNSQADFTAELTPEGYRKGGLGGGVAGLSNAKWAAFNGGYPFIPCGYTNSLGNATGVVNFTMPSEYDANNTLVVGVPSFRGVENPFGHIWKFVDGIIVMRQSDMDGGHALVQVCSNPDGYDSRPNDKYVYVGDLVRSEGYIKTIAFGDDGDVFPTIVGGGSTTYHCDYVVTSTPANGTYTTCVFIGFCANNEYYPGFTAMHAQATPQTIHPYFGTRLCYEPANRDAN